MTDATTCAHLEAEPVEVRSMTTGAVEVVAHICRSCLVDLPANWGCTDCEWVENRVLCGTVTVIPGQTCPRHRGVLV